MTAEEIALKLTPGKPSAASIPGRDWYPSGNADGVIYRTAMPRHIVKNGQLVPEKSVTIGGKSIALHDKVAKDLEAKAFRYIKPSSKEDRTNGLGFTHDIGVINHLGGFVDLLTEHFQCLKAEREKGFSFQHWMAHDRIGKDAMKPEVFAHLKVVPVEEGIFAIIYDPENEIPA